VQKLSIANELLKQPFDVLMNMSISKLNSLLDWKAQFEEKKHKKLMEKMDIIPDTKLTK
jgi:hypothetical protein